MSDYRIEKIRRSVELTLANGHRIDGDLFVQPHARFRAGPEEPADLLNDEEPFLPIVLANGVVNLVQKCQIAVVGTPLPEEDEAMDTGVMGMRVEITLVDGSTHTGTIFPDVRIDRPRLVDFLNYSSFRFLGLFTAEQLRLVNRSHIAYARPVS